MIDAPNTESPLEVIEGTITEFYYARGTVNLLDQLQKNSKARNTSAGLAAATAGLHGIVASSAMLAMYDGEDVENCICRIGDRRESKSVQNSFLARHPSRQVPAASRKAP